MKVVPLRFGCQPAVKIESCRVRRELWLKVMPLRAGCQPAAKIRQLNATVIKTLVMTVSLRPAVLGMGWQPRMKTH